MNERVDSCLMSHQQRDGKLETGPRFEVSPERQDKRRIDLVILGLVN